MRGEISDFRARLLGWYDHHKRPLPWRTAPSVYRTVVSEFMLQQTRVDTVLPYFARWMKVFPDFTALAGAPEERVLKLWEGLGYYARARNLHRLAKAVAADGTPGDAEAWRRLPGVGPYTAAAIASIAQGQPEPVIDGNVVRVLCRLTRDATAFTSAAAAHKRLLPLTRQLIDPARPGDFNEAVMELGATVCRKARPDCPNCPVRPHCAAACAGVETQLPVLVRQPATRRRIARLFAVADGRILLHFHPAGAARLAGLAELPELARAPRSAPLLTRLRGISSEQIEEAVHALPPGHAAVGKCLSLGARWIPIDQLPHIALSAPHRRWIEQLLPPPATAPVD